MKFNQLPKAKEYIGKTPRAFQQYISTNAEKLFAHIDPEKFSHEEIEVSVFEEVVEHYKAFKFATEFIEALEKKDIEKMKTLFPYVETIPNLKGRERNQKIMYLRLIENIPLVTVGEKYGISRERVRQIVWCAIDKMLYHMGHSDGKERYSMLRKLLMKR